MCNPAFRHTNLVKEQQKLVTDSKICADLSQSGVQAERVVCRGRRLLKSSGRSRTERVASDYRPWTLNKVADGREAFCECAICH